MGVERKKIVTGLIDSTGRTCSRRNRRSLLTLLNLIRRTSVLITLVRDFCSWEAKTHHAAKKRSPRRSRNGFRSRVSDRSLTSRPCSAYVLVAG